MRNLLDEIDFKNLSAEEITGPYGLLKQLSKRMIEKAMQAEMEEPPGYEKHERSQTIQIHAMEKVEKLFQPIYTPISK